MALAGPPSSSSSSSPSHNFTVLVAEVADDGYDTLVADIWVGVVLTLMVLSCVCCVCSCLLYHKFQQWKRSVLAARGPPGEATEAPYADVESLPSYTIVSGLPSYEEALRQLRLARERRESLKSASDLAAPPPASPTA
ncbi:Protein commissureless 2 homolog, partial [Gryllus bimaculatus]